MQNTYLYIAIATYIIITLALAIWSLVLEGREEDIKTRERDLEKKEEDCDRRAEMLHRAEETLEQLLEMPAPATEDEAEHIAARYVVTESDLMKYNSDTAVRNVARSRIAHVIANDIVRKFPDPIENVDGSKKTYEYRFKVTEDR